MTLAGYLAKMIVPPAFAFWMVLAGAGATGVDNTLGFVFATAAAFGTIYVSVKL